MWRATALTLFPEMFPGPLGESLAGKALKEGVWSLEAVDIRRFAKDRHGTVDDSPFGGGAGMVMKPDVLSAAIEAVAAPEVPEAPKLLLSPRGAPFTQARARELAAGPGVVLVCGRFEGVDERVIEAHALEEISVGDFVLSGGEIAAMAVIDCCVRLLPGVMGAAAVGETRRVSRTDCWSTRTTPGPRSGPARMGSNGACRRSWSRATTARSPSGGCGSGKRSRGGGGPICGRAGGPRSETKRSDERMDAMNILDTIGQAHDGQGAGRAAGAAFRAGRHAARARQGAGRQPRAPAGLRGPVHRAARTPA